MAVRFVVLAVLFCLFETTGEACLFDTDCAAVGSKCIKEESSFNGICKGGLGSTNSYDNTYYNEDRAEFFPTLDATYTDTCSFDSDCEVDQRCMKEVGTIYGVCMQEEREQERRDELQEEDEEDDY